MLQVSRPIAQELLARYVKQAQALLQRASLVGDFSDYESWKAERKQWIEQTSQALGHIYGAPEEAEEFKSAASPAQGGQRWQQQYARDLACVEAAIEILISHQRPLGSAHEPAGEWERAEEPADDPEPVEEPPPADGPELLEQREPADGHDPEEEPELADGRELEEEPVEDPQPDRRPELAEEPAPTVGSELEPASSNGAEVVQQSGNGSVSIPDRMRQVFLAHGRDEKWMQAVAHLLERSGPHAVTVLNEGPTDRRTLTEHFEEQVTGSHYAVVLLTADDVGAPRLQTEEEPYYSPRARQGVVFEMGFLVAALTPSCVCVLYEDGVEMPCDVDGIAYVRLDFAGTWQSKLLLQLRRAGFNYDLNELAPV